VCVRADAWQLFSSMERIHLLRLLLQLPEADGGCGINLLEKQHKGWFTLVPVHDGNRTKTARFPDELGTDDDGTSVSLDGSSKPPPAQSAPKRLWRLLVSTFTVVRTMKLARLDTCVYARLSPCSPPCHLTTTAADSCFRGLLLQHA
jgi:hypothetical protein